MSDKPLVIRLKRADTDAFKELYRKYIHKLFAYTLRTAKSPALAEDVVHDVFVTIWEKRDQIDPEQSFQAYLFTIARNHLLNFIKREAHKKDIIDQMIGNTVPVQSESTQERVLYNESHRLFREAIEQLPDRRKEVFQLCHLDGLTYEEAADRLDITSSTVNTQMVKARKFIREYLTEKNVMPEAE